MFQKQILVATYSFLVFHMYFYMFTYLRLSPEIGFMLYTFVGNIKMQRILKVMNKHLRIYDDLRLQLFQLISFPICHIKIWRLWGKHTVCKLFGKYSYYSAVWARIVLYIYFWQKCIYFFPFSMPKIYPIACLLQISQPLHHGLPQDGW